MDEEKKYITGFNSGYLLAKHEPVLLFKIVKDLHSTNEYLEGFFSGKEEYELEQFRIREQELENFRNKSMGRDRSLERE